MQVYRRALPGLRNRLLDRERRAFYSGRRSVLLELSEILHLPLETQATVAALLAQVTPQKRG